MKIPAALEPHLRPFARYAASGAFSAGLSLLLTTGFTEWAGLDPRASFALTLAIMLVVNFFIGRHLIYNAIDGRAGGQFLRFVCTSGAARFLEWSLFTLLVTHTPAHYLVAVLGVQGTSFCVKYVVYRRLVFAKAAS